MFDASGDVGALQGGFNGHFGVPNVEEYMSQWAALQKSFDAGHPSPTYAGGGVGSPLMAQSLEMTLAWATTQERHIRFWPKFPKAKNKLTNTVHEYTRQDSLGPTLHPFASEGQLGPLVDSEFTREFTKVKYMVVKKEVTHPMAQLTGLVGGSPALVKANKDAALWLTIALERMLFYGNSDVNSLAFDGLKKTCEDTHTAGNPKVYDFRGSPIDSATLFDEIARMIEGPNWGNPTDIWMSVGAKADLAKQLGPHMRYDIPAGLAANLGYKSGIQPSGIDGPEGPVPFETSVFLAPLGGPATTAQGEDAPSTPVVAAALSTDATSEFNSADWYGVYKYQVVAVGTKGTSAPCAAVSATVTSTNNKVTLTITAPGTDNVLYYIIYRSEVGGTATYQISEVAQAYSGGAVDDTTFVDLNGDIPNTSKAFLVENREEVMGWVQLLDFARIPLARTALTFPFAYVLYGTPVWRVPKKVMMFKNIGKLVA